MFNINSLNEDEKFALLFGILAGDGCLSLVKGRLKFISSPVARKHPTLVRREL